MTGPAAAASFKKYGGSGPENYERCFVPTIGMTFANALLEVVDVGRGERVLDVACGTGSVTRLAAERVGPDGSVAGLDVNPGMLAVARAAVPDTSIEWFEASAESIPAGDGSFDVVLCSLGLQFVPDKTAALSEMHRVLTKGGRVAIGTVAPSPLFEILEQALARHVSPEVAAFMSVVFSLGEQATLRELIAGAGFTDVRVESKNAAVRLPEPSEFLWQYASSTPLWGAVSKLDDGERAALERDVVAGWQSFVEGGSLIFEPTIVLSTARR